MRKSEVFKQRVDIQVDMTAPTDHQVRTLNEAVRDLQKRVNELEAKVDQHADILE